MIHGAGGVSSKTHVIVPAFIMGAAALFWGWHQSVLVYAVMAAIAVEFARYASFRWDFDNSDYHRLGDVTGVGLLLLVIVQFSDRGMSGIYGVLRWFPLVLLGLTLAQLYSTRVAMPLSAMFYSVRLAIKRKRISQPGELDLRLPFLIACMLSASASICFNARSEPLGRLARRCAQATEISTAWPVGTTRFTPPNS